MIFKKGIFQHFNLKTKLLLTYIIITIIPTALLGYISYSQYVASIEQQVGVYVPRLLNQANNNLEKQIDRYYDEMGQLYNNTVVMNLLRKADYQNVSNMKQDKHQVDNYLSSTFMEGGREHVIGAFIVSKERLFEYSRVPYQSGFSTKEKIGLYGQSYNLQSEEQIFFPHETVIQFRKNKPYILLVKQIIDYENRKNLGTLYVAIDIKFMEQTLSTVDEQEDARMWMFDKDGYIIYHSTSSLIGTRDLETENYPIENGSFKSSSFLYSSANSLNNRWTFMHVIPVSHLTVKSDFVRNLTIISFLVIVVISIISSILMAWSVAKPIQQLVKEMKKVEKGNFNVHLTDSSNSEVGVLSKAFTKMLKEIKDLINEKYNIGLKQKEAELYALQSQINPHFMYNTLENIAFMVEEGEQESVVEMVTNLGRMLRYSLGNKEQMVPLKMELRHVEDYLMIQQARFEDTLRYSVIVNSASLEKFTPKFILQPLIENIFLHAFIPGQILQITLKVIKEKNNIKIIIEDNGKGIDSNKLELIRNRLNTEHLIHKEDSFGLSNVNRRLVLHFGSTYFLRIESEKGEGTTVTLIIPITNKGSIHENE